MQKVFILLLSLFLTSVFAEVISYDAEKDFSKGHLDLQTFIVETEKIIMESDPVSYETCCKRLEEFTTWLADQVTEDNLKTSSMIDLLGRIVAAINQKGKMVDSQNFLLPAFLEKRPGFDCDTTCEIVHITLYKLQKKFSHYQILDNFHVVLIPGHALCAIKIAEQEALFGDLNKEVAETKKLEFSVESQYVEKADISMKLVLLKGEQLKTMKLTDVAYHHLVMGDVGLTLSAAEEALSYFSDNDGALYAKARCLYRQGKYEETILLEKRFDQIDESSVTYEEWALALCKLEKFEEAVNLLDQQIEKGNDNPLLYFARAEAYMGLSSQALEGQKEEYIKKALQDFKDAFGLHLDPNHLVLQKLRETAAQMDGETLAKFEGALAMYSKALDVLREWRGEQLACFFYCAGFDMSDLLEKGVFKEVDEETEETPENLKIKAEQAEKFETALSVCQEYERVLESRLFHEAKISAVYSCLFKQGGIRLAERFMDFQEKVYDQYNEDCVKLYMTLPLTAKEEANDK